MHTYDSDKDNVLVRPLIQSLLLAIIDIYHFSVRHRHRWLVKLFFSCVLRQIRALVHVLDSCRLQANWFDASVKNGEVEERFIVVDFILCIV